MDRAAIQERFGILGTSPVIQHVIDRSRLVARTDITVLIQGESGVGKELVAHAVHELSPRRHKPLVIVNCGAIPEGLIESELFGNEKGAYTGAVERRNGYFEEADQGTIFLDEVGEMPAAAQVRLLRVLETGEFSRVGSSVTRKTNARVVAATNKDLGAEVQRGRFREDLYYRLSTVIVMIPALRERREDIIPIFEHYLYRFAQKYNSPVKRLDESARQLLLRYHWPGNVRELRNVVEQSIVLTREETLTADVIRGFLRGVSASQGAGELVPVARPGVSAGGSMESLELVYRALLELRMEMRELQQQVGRLAGSYRGPGQREYMEPRGFEDARGDFVILRDSGSEDDVSGIEDVPFEIAVEEEKSRSNGARGHAQTAGPAPLPTLEDAERRLIGEALERFDGNRRQTAKALGISERTLYRKLKELGETP